MEGDGESQVTLAGGSGALPPSVREGKQGHWALHLHTALTWDSTWRPTGHQLGLGTSPPAGNLGSTTHPTPTRPAAVWMIHGPVVTTF